MKVNVEFDLSTELGRTLLTGLMAAVTGAQAPAPTTAQEPVAVTTPASPTGNPLDEGGPITETKPKARRGREPKQPIPEATLPPGLSPAIIIPKDPPNDALPADLTAPNAEESQPPSGTPPTFERVQECCQKFYEKFGAAGLSKLLVEDFGVKRWREVPIADWPKLLNKMGFQ